MRLLCAITLLSFSASAQPTTDEAYRQMLESKRQITGYLERAALAITNKAAAELASRQSWEQVRATRFDEMRDMLGLLPGQSGHL